MESWQLVLAVLWVMCGSGTVAICAPEIREWEHSRRKPLLNSPFVVVMMIALWPVLLFGLESRRW